LATRRINKGIYVASLDSNERKFIVATDTNAAYAPVWPTVVHPRQMC
jgi:hypothetical protein